MIALSVTMSFPLDEIEEIKKYVGRMMELSRKDEGCVEYWWTAMLDQPDTLHLFEVWESQELLQAHLAQPFEKEYMEQIQPKVTSIDVKYYNVEAAGA